jgi:hypothetical protein
MKRSSQVRKSRGADLEALGKERYLPRAARQDWSRDRVFSQIEELNALVDPLLCRLPADERARRVIAARVRAGAVRTAAGWVSAASVAHAKAFLESQVVEPEDAFGPAFLLQALASDDPRTRELLSRVPASIGRLLVELA